MTSFAARILLLSIILNSAPIFAEPWGIFKTCAAALSGTSVSLDIKSPAALTEMLANSGQETVGTFKLSLQELQEISNIQFHQKMEGEYSQVPDLVKSNEDMSKKIGKFKMLQTVLFALHSMTLAPATLMLAPSLTRGFGTDPVWTSALFFLGVEIIAGSLQILVQAAINPDTMKILSKSLLFPFNNNRLKLAYLSELTSQPNQYRVEKFNVLLPDRKVLNVENLIEDLRWQKELAKNYTFAPLLTTKKPAVTPYNMYVVVDTQGPEPIINVVLTEKD